MFCGLVGSLYGQRPALEEYQPLHVVEDVGEPDLRGGTGDADGSDEQAHPALLLGKDVLDTRVDLR